MSDLNNPTYSQTGPSNLSIGGVPTPTGSGSQPWGPNSANYVDTDPSQASMMFPGTVTDLVGQARFWAGNAADFAQRTDAPVWVDPNDATIVGYSAKWWAITAQQWAQQDTNQIQDPITGAFLGYSAKYWAGQATVAGTNTITFAAAAATSAASAATSATAATVSAGTAQTWANTAGQSAASAGVSAFNAENAAAVVEANAEQRIIPLTDQVGFSLLYTDTNGNAAGGVKGDGALYFSQVQADSLQIVDTTQDELDYRVPFSRVWADANGHVAMALDNEGKLHGTLPSGTSLDDISPTQAADAIRLVFEQTRRHQNSFGTGPLAPNTFHTTWALESAFDMVRLGFTYDAATSCQINGCIIAASAAINDSINPLDGNGNPANWVQVTFNNNGADLDYGQQLAATPPPAPITTLALAPAPNDQRMAVTWSDWMPLSSFVRTDGGELPLLMVRAYLTGAVRPSNSGPNSTAWDSVNEGRIVRSFAQNVDGVTTPSNFTNTTLTGWLTPVNVQYITRARGFSIMAVGDSCLAGATTTNNANNFIFQAAAQLSTPDRPVSPVNLAFGGAVYSDYFWNAFNLIDVLQPSVVVIQSGSRNGTGPYATLSGSMEVFRRGMALAERVREYGGTPVLVTPWPDQSETTATDPYRIAVANAVRQAARSGVLMVDADVLVGVLGNPSTLNPAYTNDDTHLNDAGHAVLAQALVKVLSPLMQ